MTLDQLEALIASRRSYERDGSAFKVGDIVKKVRGGYTPYVMVVTKIYGDTLIGDIIEGGHIHLKGRGSDFAYKFELVTPKSIKPTDAELAATYRAGRAAGVELGKRGFTIRNDMGTINHHEGLVTITKPEVLETVVKSPRVEL